MPAWLRDQKAPRGWRTALVDGRRRDTCPVHRPLGAGVEEGGEDRDPIRGGLVMRMNFAAARELVARAVRRALGDDSLAHALLLHEMAKDAWLVHALRSSDAGEARARARGRTKP